MEQGGNVGMSRDRVLGLARRLEGQAGEGGVLDPAERAICVEALRRFAEGEAVFEAAEAIERATGIAWHDPQVIRAATDIARRLSPA